MNAIKLALFIFAFTAGVGIINGSGLFDTEVTSPDIDLPGADLADGITEVDSGLSSTDDTESAFDAGSMVLNMLSTVKTIFAVLAVPGALLYNYGVPAVIALAVQGMVNLVEVIGLIQIYSNRSFKGMD